MIIITYKVIHFVREHNEGSRNRYAHLKSSFISGTFRHMVYKTPLVRVLILMTSQVLLGSQSDQQNFPRRWLRPFFTLIRCRNLMQHTYELSLCNKSPQTSIYSLPWFLRVGNLRAVQLGGSGSVFLEVVVKPLSQVAVILRSYPGWRICSKYFYVVGRPPFLITEALLSGCSQHGSQFPSERERARWKAKCLLS